MELLGTAISGAFALAPLLIAGCRRVEAGLVVGTAAAVGLKGSGMIFF